jgi:hypothetical protein
MLGGNQGGNAAGKAGWFFGQARHLVRKDPAVGVACHHVPVVRPLSILPDRAGEYSGGRLSARSARRLVTG